MKMSYAPSGTAELSDRGKNKFWLNSSESKIEVTSGSQYLKYNYLILKVFISLKKRKYLSAKNIEFFAETWKNATPKI